MKNKVLVGLMVLVVLGMLAGQVSATVNGVTLRSPADGSCTSDRTPEFSFNATSDNLTGGLTATLYIDDTKYGTISYTNNTVGTITANSTLDYKKGYVWKIGVTDAQGEVNSSTRTLDVTRFCDAKESITGVKDLLTPIGNLIIALIVIFLALFIVKMLKDLFGGVGGAMKETI